MNEINLKGVDQSSRVRILKLIRDRYGYREACRILNISQSSMYRYLNGRREVPDSLLSKMLEYVSRDEFYEILSGGEKLRALGFIKDDGSIDYSAAVEFLKVVFQDEYLKNLALEFIVREYREELKKLLGVSLSVVEFHWNDEFEYFLKNLKRRRKISTDETIRYYRNLFQKYLEGRRLSMRLIDEVVKNENKWLRNIFRHYMQFLYSRRQISPEAFGWLMMVVPSRSYRMEPVSYPIKEGDVVKTLRFLRENNEIYYTIYRFMLESGARIVHTIRILSEWNPDEEIEISGLGYTRRLVVFKDFARYYVGYRDVVKRCEWIYISLETLELVKKYAGRKVNRSYLSRYAKKHSLLLPKYMRKYSWRIMVRSLGRELARFLQSRFGELKISETRYEDLLSEADEKYPEYLSKLSILFKSIS